MDLSDREKAKQGAEALSIFFSQLGPPNTHNRIIWEELFEEMRRNENLPVPGEKGQKRDKNSSPPKK